MTTTIFERVKTALATLSPIQYALDSMMMTGGDLPDQYLVYNLPNAAPVAHFDDQEAARRYQVQVAIYSRAGLVSLPNVDAAMLAAGFTRSSERVAPNQGDHYCLEKSYYFHNDP
ncbi:MAG: hypothetical protein EHM81_07100 [Chloroflexi bacterium]|nr:MAG: hypothetical protein EHM81_07100 [Chloroflexota bacterium]